MNSTNKHLDLLTKNVNEHIEKKGNLSYLSWSWAWSEALKADENATFEVKCLETYLIAQSVKLVWFG